MTLVLDASVIVKWLLQDPQRESDSDAATRVVEAVVTGAESVLAASALARGGRGRAGSRQSGHGCA